MSLAWLEVTLQQHLPGAPVIDIRRSSLTSRSFSDEESGSLRNPSRTTRQLIVGAVLAIPGAVAGLMVGLLPHSVMSAALVLIGSMVGLIVGIWIERT